MGWMEHSLIVGGGCWVLRFSSFLIFVREWGDGTLTTLRLFVVSSLTHEYYSCICFRFSLGSEAFLKHPSLLGCFLGKSLARLEPS